MLRNVLIATLISLSFACTPDGTEHAAPLTPVRLPGPATTCLYSTLTWSGSSPETDKAPLWADFRSLVEMEDQLIGQLFDRSFDSDGFKFPLDMREAEMAIEDLRTLVRTSDRNDREILADSLVELLKCVRNLRKSWVRFYAGVRDTLDSILLGRGHALRVMERASPELPTPRFRGFWPFPDNKAAKTGAVNHVFTGSVDSFSVKVARLSVGAEAPLVDLVDLNKQLAKIQETILLKASRKASDRASNLSNLWAELSENTAAPKRIDKNLRVLRSFDSTKNYALAYVTSAQRALQTAKKQMVELRWRVSIPEHVSEGTPTAVHMNSLRDGLENLQEIKNREVERRKRVIADTLAEA